MPDQAMMTPAGVDRELMVMHLRDLRTLYAVIDTLEQEQDRLIQVEQEWLQWQPGPAPEPEMPTGPTIRHYEDTWGPDMPQYEQYPEYPNDSDWWWDEEVLGWLARGWIVFVYTALGFSALATDWDPGFGGLTMLALLPPIGVGLLPMVPDLLRWLPYRCKVARIKAANKRLEAVIEPKRREHEARYEAEQARWELVLAEWYRTREAQARQWVAQQEEQRRREIQSVRDEAAEALAEKREAERLLAETYATNLVPQQFRMPQAIHFLHEYVSTSQETLTSALLHCDLNEIKGLLHAVIAEQGLLLLRSEMALSALDDLRRQESNLIDEVKALSGQMRNSSHTQSEQLAAMRHHADIAARHTSRIEYMGRTRILPELIKLNR
jgi:hypothetical protein